jgi:hypothetical protein
MAVAYFPDYGTAGKTACYVDCDASERQLAGTNFSAGIKVSWTWSMLLLFSAVALGSAI